MSEVDARLAMNDMVRILIQAEDLARRTRGNFYLRDPNQFPELRAVLGARSDYVLSVEALAVPGRAATKRHVGVQATQVESGPLERGPSVLVVGPRDTSIIVISGDSESSKHLSVYQPHQPLADVLVPGEMWYREQ